MSGCPTGIGFSRLDDLSHITVPKAIGAFPSVPELRHRGRKKERPASTELSREITIQALCRWMLLAVGCPLTTARYLLSGSLPSWFTLDVHRLGGKGDLFRTIAIFRSVSFTRYLTIPISRPCVHGRLLRMGPGSLAASSFKFPQHLPYAQPQRPCSYNRNH